VLCFPFFNVDERSPVMVGMSFIELLIIVVMGGSPLGLPLSLPPLPEDPALSQVAPQECLWYLAWFGCAKPDASSKNHTEQLLAEQDIQRFVSELEVRLRDALKRGAPQGPRAAQAAVLAEEGPNLLKLALTRPTAVFVESAVVGPAGVDVKGGAVISAGDQAEQVKKSIDRIASAVIPPEAKANGKQPGELKLPMPQGAPAVEIAWHNNYLIVGVGDGAVETIRKRFGGKAPEWLANVRKELAVERPAMVHYLNVQTVLATAVPLAGLQGFKVVNVLGLDRLKYYANVNGLEGAGSVSRSLLAMDGKPRGLLALLEGEPLKAAELAAIPKDATLAVTGKFDLDKTLNAIVDLVGQFDPQARQQFQTQMADIDRQVGFSIRDEIFKSLGDTWSVYNSPGEGGLVITGLTAVVPVKDRERLLKAHDKLLSAAPRAPKPQPPNPQGGNGNVRTRGAFVADFQYGGRKVHFMNFIGDEVPFAPAWCITDKELIVSPFPQMIKARLSRGTGAGSLADVPEVAQCFQGGRQPRALFYQDTRTIFRLVYPMVHFLAGILCAEWQQHGLDIDVSLLPSMAAIEPHLQPGVTAVYMTQQGLRWEARHTLPMATGAAPLLVAPVAFFGIARTSVNQSFRPSDESALFIDLEAVTPEGARQAQSTNNLKQIGLAMHNFADVHKRFPVADGAASDGKPKLSWRVHILPFMEQQALFNEFKLDEPWDSEHNKKLIEKMPPFYQAPGTGVADKHKTNYVTVRGKDTMFPAGKAARFSDIKDGLSNTAMVVEVSDDQAVVWTKPDDFEPDAENPLKGVVGLRRGKFLMLFGDASVQALSESLDKETVRAIYTRAGGEVVDFSRN
jgi:hypothetical protein